MKRTETVILYRFGSLTSFTFPNPVEEKGSLCQAKPDLIAAERYFQVQNTENHSQETPEGYNNGLIKLYFFSLSI